VGAALLAACATATPDPAPEQIAAAMRWDSPLGREHVLAGRVWAVEDGRFVTPAQLARRLGRARYVLLGEKHDNADHHRLQAWILRQIILGGGRPAVAFEMFDTAQAPAIARHLAAAPRDAAGLGEAVDWERSGWPPWELYQPIAQAALDAGLEIVPANITRDVARALARQGLSGVDYDVATQLRLNEPLPGPVQARMLAEIREAHCGTLGEGSAERMVLAQRARDAQMARSLVRADRGAGGVLIAGAGHVSDHGVPAHLAELAPGAPVAAVALLEVRAGDDAPLLYARGSEGRLPYDYVWFTPRTDDRDPCEAFRRRGG
jgi:uncharacterized iron-regulated protein